MTAPHDDVAVGDPAAALARFVADGDTSSPAWRHRARILLADALVLARAAADVPQFAEVAQLGAGTGRHRSWAGGPRLGAADAVHANAAAVHARFQDDTDMSTWSHPGSFVVPAAAAAAIEADRPLSAVLDALVVGYAGTVWLGGDGEVARAMKPRGLRPSPVFAPLGAAAAASRALGLTAEQTTHALNAAALLGRGTLHSVGVGGQDWRLHNPGAAQDGFRCALAAGRGMRSGPGALTAKHGFLATVTGSPRPPTSWASPPSADLMLTVWQKALPVLGDIVAVALAAGALHHRVAGQPILGVSVHMNAEYAAFPGTQTGPPFPSTTAAQASVRFATAQQLLHGTLTYDDLNRPAGAELDDLADRIEVVPGPDLAYTDAVVEVTTASGVLSCRTRDLPATLFYRDDTAQRAFAGDLLGAPGSGTVDCVLDADENTPFADVVERALDA